MQISKENMETKNNNHKQTNKTKQCKNVGRDCDYNSKKSKKQQQRASDVCLFLCVPVICLSIIVISLCTDHVASLCADIVYEIAIYLLTDCCVFVVHSLPWFLCVRIVASAHRILCILVISLFTDHSESALK